METYEEIKKAAEVVRSLYKKGFVINITGAGRPSVLMTDEGFDELFPDAERVVYQDGDGATWDRREVERDGIRFQSYRKV